MGSPDRGPGSSTDRLHAAVDIAFTGLTPDQRAAWLLHDVFGMPLPEVARVMGREPGDTGDLLDQARRAVGETGC